MFQCERCGSSYSATHIGVEHCPRCLLRDRVQAPLAFKVFRQSDMPSAMKPPGKPLPQEPPSGPSLSTDAP
jgi:late competence protein required for DNA uptake (superfamily II DNA/RNA helicase)